MASMIASPCALVELTVVFFQLVGLSSLAVVLMAPGLRWAWRARRLFILALIGLGLSGALCSSYDSRFALFAGATMTGYLIVATLVTSHHEPTPTALPRIRPETVAVA